jgi:hypothetical protein
MCPCHGTSGRYEIREHWAVLFHVIPTRKELDCTTHWMIATSRLEKCNRYFSSWGSKMTDGKAKDHGWLEAKQSGGAVYELGVKQSKHGKTIRRIAEPLMEKHWKNSVTNLHRIYRVSEYLLTRQKRSSNKDNTKLVNESSLGSFFKSCLSTEENKKRKKK